MPSCICHASTLISVEEMKRIRSRLLDLRSLNSGIQQEIMRGWLFQTMLGQRFVQTMVSAHREAVTKSLLRWEQNAGHPFKWIDHAQRSSEITSSNRL